MEGNIIIEKEKEIDLETSEINTMLSEAKLLEENNNQEEYSKLISVITERKRKLDLLFVELINLISDSAINVVDEYWSWVCSLEK
jgi:hypothetical protein